MTRRNLFLGIMLISILFLAVGSVSAVEYKEAPMLTEKVNSGELPPVAERLPEEPIIVEPLDEIGVYGGTLRRGITGPNDHNNYVRWMYDSLVRYAQDGNSTYPHLIKSLEPNEDYTVWTFNMLKGAKWSDGSPFTSADIMFWFEDYYTYPELTPAKLPWLYNDDGSIVEVTAPDEYTVVFTYKDPITTVPMEVAAMDNRDNLVPMFLPSAYLKQFHAKYTDVNQLNEMAKKESFENWKQLFENRQAPYRNPERPVMAAWMSVNTINDPIYNLVRNPYYVCVDPEGNQLPYIDNLSLVTYQSPDALNMAAIQGEIDMQDRHIIMQNYPVLMQESEKTGKYDVRLWPTFGGVDAALSINYYYDKDPEYMKLFQNHDFRVALSISIDREEIIESAFLGLGEARQPVPRSTSIYYPGDEYAFKYTEFDQAKANELLDAMGLDKKDANGFRLMPNGSRVMIEIAYVPQFANWGDIAQMIAEDWRGVGIEGVVVENERTNHFAKRDSNELMTEIWNEDTTGFPFTGAPKFDPRTSPGICVATGARMWLNSEGKEGYEPNEDFKRIMEIIDLAKRVGPEEQQELGKELFRIWAEGCYEIGIAGLTPMVQGVGVVNANLGNVPASDTLGNDWPLRTPGNGRTEQFYFKQ